MYQIILFLVIILPFTPYHFGPALLLGILFFPYVDFFSIFLSSVIVDIEPFIILVFGLRLPLHGFFHSFLGGGILVFFSVVLTYSLKPFLNRFLQFFKVYQETNFRKVVSTSFLGVFIHIILDAFLYNEMNPFYPFIGNPFLSFLDYFTVYQICIWSFFIGLSIYLYNFVIKN